MKYQRENRSKDVFVVEKKIFNMHFEFLQACLRPFMIAYTAVKNRVANTKVNICTKTGAKAVRIN